MLKYDCKIISYLINYIGVKIIINIRIVIILSNFMREQLN